MYECILLGIICYAYKDSLSKDLSYDPVFPIMHWGMNNKKGQICHCFLSCIYIVLWLLLLLGLVTNCFETSGPIFLNIRRILLESF